MSTRKWFQGRRQSPTALSKALSRHSPSNGLNGSDPDGPWSISTQTQITAAFASECTQLLQLADSMEGTFSRITVGAFTKTNEQRLTSYLTSLATALVRESASNRSTLSDEASQPSASQTRNRSRTSRLFGTRSPSQLSLINSSSSSSSSSTTTVSSTAVRSPERSRRSTTTTYEDGRQTATHSSFQHRSSSDFEPTPAPATTTGPCLQIFLEKAVLARLAPACSKNNPPNARLMFLQFFRRILRSVNHPFLLHQHVLLALNATVEGCVGPKINLSEQEQVALLRLINEVMKSLRRDSAHLPLLFVMPKSTEGSPTFPVFEALARYMHHPGRVGNEARSALVLCLELSTKHDELDRYLLKESSFTVELVGQLSALFSQLPSRLPGDKNAWKMRAESIPKSIPALSNFLTMISFCNDIMSLCSPKLSDVLAKQIHKGFLDPVVRPVLHQDDMASRVAHTSYLEVTMRHISNEKLLRSYLQLLLHSKSDEGQDTFDRLVLQLEEDDGLCLPTLGLFLTLLTFNCEDVLLRMGLDALHQGMHLELEIRTPGSYTPSCFEPSSVVKQDASRRLLEFAQGADLKSPKYQFSSYVADAIDGCQRNAIGCLSWSRIYVAPYHRRTENGSVDGHSDADQSSSGQSNAAGEIRPEPGQLNKHAARPKSKFAGLKRQVMSSTAGSTVPSSSAQASSGTDFGLPSQNTQHLCGDGLFLRVLFRKLNHMLDYSAQMNVLLASVVVCLAQYPMPCLRDFLFDPSLPVNKDMSTLRRALGVTSERITKALESEPDLQLFIDHQLYGKMQQSGPQLSSLLKPQVGGDEPSKPGSDNSDLEASRLNPSDGSAFSSYSPPRSVGPIDDDVQSTMSMMSSSERLFLDHGMHHDEAHSETRRIVKSHPKRKELTKLASRIVVYREFVKNLAAVCAEQSLAAL